MPPPMWAEGWEAERWRRDSMVSKKGNWSAGGGGSGGMGALSLSLLLLDCRAEVGQASVTYGRGAGEGFFGKLPEGDSGVLRLTRRVWGRGLGRAEGAPR